MEGEERLTAWMAASKDKTKGKAIDKTKTEALRDNDKTDLEMMVPSASAQKIK